MPTYVYHCNDCNKEHEKTQRMIENADPLCPHCGQKTAVRVILPCFIVDGRPSWDRSIDISRYINKMKPKYIRDDKTGIRMKYPKGGV